MNLIDFLQGVPAPAWGLAGAVVGVIGTLGATALSNGSNDQRFEKQLKHDAEQKSKDRAAELRRDVYLSAADELVGINAFLGQLALADPTDTNIMSGGVIGFFKATSRVSLVASEKTRMKVADLSGAYGRLFIELMADASAAHRLKIDININRDRYENLKLERMRLISAMRDANENTESKYKFESLSRSFESTVEPMEEISSEFSELSEKYNDALANFGATTTDKIAALAEQHAEVSALLRSEFDLDVDVEGMKTQFRDQSAKASDAGKKFFAKLKKMREEDAGEERA